MNSGVYKGVNPPASGEIPAGGGQKGGQNAEVEAAVNALFELANDALNAFWDALERGATLEEAKGEFRAVMAKGGW